MSLDNQHAVDVFNGLIESARDSADGYEKAAELARNPRFRSLFQERALARRQLTQDLKDEIDAFGDETADNGTLLGQAHRVFAELRDKVSGSSDKAIIEEVERGETFVHDKFEKAAADTALPAPARQLVETACQAIAADRDQTSALKNEFQ